MNPSIGTTWRFKSLNDETPAEKEANRFTIVGRDGEWVDYTKEGDTLPTRRKAKEFHKLFERILPPIE
jgi:hypothetical protein